MSHVEKSIEVDRPISTVYNQWTQFETFPEFMEGVEKVEQLDDKRLHWQAEIAGATREWDAEIVEQTPDQVIAWRATGEIWNAGRVRFDKLAADKTKVTVNFEYEPEGFVEKAGDFLGVVDGRIASDLKKFKKFIEDHTTETGAWRGEIHGGSTPA